MTRNARFIDERITLKYGSGGGAMRALIEQVFAKGLGKVEDGIGLGAETPFSSSPLSAEAAPTSAAWRAPGDFFRISS